MNRNSSSSASVRWRFMAPTLALSFAGLVLAGCARGGPDRDWTVVASVGSNADAFVYRDNQGCYWFASLREMHPLLSHDGQQKCDGRLSDRTAISVGPSSPKTGSTR